MNDVDSEEEKKGYHVSALSSWFFQMTVISRGRLHAVIGIN